MSKSKLILPALFFTLPAYSQVITGEGTFPISTSVNHACVMAEQKAIEQAIKKVRGENIEVNRNLTCVEKNNLAPACTFDDYTFNSLNGNVKEIKSSRIVVDNKQCSASVTVLVEPTSIFSVSVDGRNIYKHGDRMFYYVAVSIPVYLYVFNQVKNEVKMVYPPPGIGNEILLDVNYFPPKPMTMLATLPKNETVSREKLIFLFSRHKIDVQKYEWSKDELQELISSLPHSSRRVVNRDIIIHN